ncbi:MAG: TIGR02757 family protein [Thermodesulfobacteriota bacterium]
MEQDLKTYLDDLYAAYSINYLSSDPLEFVHRFEDPRDKEIVGLIASSLAYGNVERIIKSINSVLNGMEDTPYAFILSYNPYRDSKRFSSFIHRFNSGEDIACLISFIKQIIERHGSIRDFFLTGYKDDDPNIRPALQSFVDRVLSLDASPFYGGGFLPKKAGVRFLFPSPENGSPCKRLNLYLRWMIRRGDSLDTGLWNKVSPDKLIIPLDTHIARISRYIGLTRRKTQDWKMAEEITGGLKRLDPEDPVKYDFALCRLGILKECTKRKDPDKCKQCLLEKICLYP